MALPAAVYEVDSPAELRRTLPLLQANDTLKIAPGTYPGGQQVRELAALTIEGMDAKNPPLFTGGNVGWHFIRTPGLTLRHLHIRGMKHNGVNLDDGGKMTSPVAGITLEHLNIEDIGPDGNFDAIKCSGLQKLAIRHCQISGWGGQAIDLVGCREVRISECEMRGKSGFSQHTGPQFKGGCEDIILEKCRLIDAGPRPIQVGGSTGEAYFRPPGATWEARRVTVRENLIEGGQCATAFTGCT
ncbi:MAG: right-handed parallel beta-helix repeat-containing protein, partial [Verrucomicrobiales bacterium]